MSDGDARLNAGAAPSAGRPVSAARLAAELGEQLPRAADVPPESFDLVAQGRRLVEAVVLTDALSAERAAAAREIAAVADRLARARRDDAVLLVRHPDGRVEN